MSRRETRRANIGVGLQVIVARIRFLGLALPIPILLPFPLLSSPANVHGISLKVRDRLEKVVQSEEIGLNMLVASLILVGAAEGDVSKLAARIAEKEERFA